MRVCLCACCRVVSNEKEMKTRCGEIQRRYWIGQWWLCFEGGKTRCALLRQGRQAGRQEATAEREKPELRRAVPFFFVSLCLVVVTKKKKKGVMR